MSRGVRHGRNLVRLTRNQISEIRNQISEIKVSHLKNGRVLVMRMRNTNLKQNEHVFGEMGVYYACAVPLESLYACAIVVDMGQKSPEKSEIKLDFEISYALERRVGPLAMSLSTVVIFIICSPWHISIVVAIYSCAR